MDVFDRITEYRKCADDSLLFTIRSYSETPPDTKITAFIPPDTLDHTISDDGQNATFRSYAVLDYPDSSGPVIYTTTTVTKMGAK